MISGWKMGVARAVVLIAIVLVGPLPGSTAWADPGDFYLGIGGGMSALRPVPEADNIRTLDMEGELFSLVLGTDLNHRNSAQFQLMSVGGGVLANDATIDYHVYDVGVLHRFYDTRDYTLASQGFNVYGRFGIGYIDRDIQPITDLRLRSKFYYSIGAGAEVALSRHFSLRAEATYIDDDVQTFEAQLVSRWGGRERPPELIPEENEPFIPSFKHGSGSSGSTSGGGRSTASGPRGTLATPSTTAQEQVPQGIPVPRPATRPTVPVPQAPRPASVPVPVPVPVEVPLEISAEDLPVETPLEDEEGLQEATDDESLQEETADDDKDGVLNTLDQCSRSTSGYPVKKDGCALLNGTLAGIRFRDGTSEMLPSAYRQLDVLATVMRRYPTTRIKLVAHTDDRGSSAQQIALTRNRLVAIGRYLLTKGVSANRLKLQAMGARQPLTNQRSSTARARNNRVSVYEAPR